LYASVPFERPESPARFEERTVFENSAVRAINDPKSGSMVASRFDRRPAFAGRWLMPYPSIPASQGVRSGARWDRQPLNQTVNPLGFGLGAGHVSLFRRG